MTTEQVIPVEKYMSTPYFRAYSHLAKAFLPFAILTSTNELFAKAPDGVTSIRVEGVEIDFFLGKFCENGDPIYENDIVEIATMTEFGSALMDRGVVRFDREHLCYFIESESVKEMTMPLPTKIVRVIGHGHG